MNEQYRTQFAGFGFRGNMERTGQRYNWRMVVAVLGCWDRCGQWMSGLIRTCRSWSSKHRVIAGVDFRSDRCGFIYGWPDGSPEYDWRVFLVHLGDRSPERWRTSYWLAFSGELFRWSGNFSLLNNLDYTYISVLRFPTTETTFLDMCWHLGIYMPFCVTLSNFLPH